MTTKPVTSPQVRGCCSFCVHSEMNTTEWLIQRFAVYRLQSPTELFMNYKRRGCGPGSSVGTATGYGLDGPGIESRWGRDFCTFPDRPWGPPSLLYNGYRVFPGGRKRLGRDADPQPLLVPRSRKQSRAIPLLSLRAFVACKKG
jgi:hypothetical protein